MSNRSRAAAPATLPSNVDATSDGSLLQTFLADRDVPCPQCSYNLRDLHGSRCPECGEDLVLRVNVAEPRQAALITGLVGLSAGAGLSGLLVLYIVIQMLRHQQWSGVGRFFAITGGGLLVEGAALLLWLWFWRSIRRARVGVRIALAVACWLLTLANLLVFSFTIK